jgi:hypothetical protein
VPHDAAHEQHRDAGKSREGEYLKLVTAARGNAARKVTAAPDESRREREEDAQLSRP